jgi:CBS domain containing-hemolysin-like protein
MPIEEASALVIDRMHSRVPVYDETRGPEHIVGVVYSKDLSRLMFFRLRQPRTSEAPQNQGIQGPDSETVDASRPRSATPFVDLRLRQVMRDVLVAPETKTVLDLIGEFQQRRRHMAIVVDEYGSTSGLVTAEDAIEQLTGELEDEFDDPARPLLTTGSGALLLDGGVNLRDLEMQTQWKLPREGGVETLAGFILMRLGRIPRGGESVDYEGRRLTVVEMDGRRISKVRVEPIEQKPAIAS